MGGIIIVKSILYLIECIKIISVQLLEYKKSKSVHKRKVLGDLDGDLLLK